jgi:ribosomal protein L37AE/L43A
MSTDDVFTCEQCGRTFTKGWSDDEADAEALRTQGVRRGAPGTALVCDDCYRKRLKRMMKKGRGREN